MWFQHDGAPPHYTNDVRQHLNVTFGQNLIGRGIPTQWPARSPDLSFLDFFAGSNEDIEVQDPIYSVEDAIARISVAVWGMRDLPGIFQNIRNSMQLRCEACMTASG
ncbi:hypothetical protein AVEN_3196-1 [Araneus ventricosus]|uniref:Tc1-like transposase DDE domain-containing protein n=1 Tax=Araneus ventricosus TaxID=182803 RepID=A0A4Y2QGU8_ARAVE|nr:hypothetical protein AVEN_3196-1 [Araneus ventricosus]